MVPEQETPVAFDEAFDQHWMEAVILFVGVGLLLNALPAETVSDLHTLLGASSASWRGDHAFYPVGEWVHIVLITVHFTQLGNGHTLWSSLYILFLNWFCTLLNFVG